MDSLSQTNSAGNTNPEANEPLKLERVILDHHFNYEIDLVLPGLQEVPSSISSELKEQHACLIHRVPLLSLLDEEFVDAFVRRGPLYMMSHNTHVDSDDCAVLIPPGNLILSLTKDTYQQLGLAGKGSKMFPKAKQNRYVVDIPLNAPYFHPGKKLYERVKAAFEQRLNPTFDFLTSWVPDDPNVCPSSLKFYFGNIRGFTVDEIPMSLDVETQRNVHLPLTKPKHSKTQPAEGAVDSRQFLEFLGGIACGINFVSNADDFASSFYEPDPSVQVDTCVVCRYKGFFTPQTISTIGEVLRECSSVNLENVQVPWAAMTVHGFQDAPLSWGRTEHENSPTGDNFYTLVYHKENRCWIYKGTSSGRFQFTNHYFM